MFDLGKQTIFDEPILRYEVWFQVPLLELFDSILEAQDACKANDFDPKLVIVPVPIGITKSSYEILIK